MKECTFRPQTNKKKKKKQKKQNHKIMVPGWDRFKELKELSLKKQQEIEQRQHDVFNVSCKVLKSRRRNASGSLQTVSKPFNLQTANKTNKKCNKHNKEEFNLNKSKSFQPATTLSKQREMVWNILQQQSQCDDTQTISHSDSFSMDSLLTSYDLSSDRNPALSDSDMSIEKM